MRFTTAVEEYLLVWVLLAVALGLAVPQLSVITVASTPILAVMIGAISLTLTIDQFRSIRPRSLGVVLAGHAAMPLLAWGLARALGLGPAVTVGFVVLGAVTPELVTPVMTDLADGETALATTALVVTGVLSVAFVPLAVTVLVGNQVAVDATRIVRNLAVAVVLPMGLAIGLRHRYPSRVARHERFYTTVSALMVVLIIGGVAAANAGLIRANLDLLGVVGVAAVALNASGYLLGWVGSWGLGREARIAAMLSVGMRDFAVAAALVVASGFPPAAALPAVVFGVVEMATSAGLARHLGGR